MFEVNGTTIRMTRGDTARFSITVNNPDGTEYTLQTGDIITFTMKKHAGSTAADLTKTGAEIVIDHDDTASLAVGEYVYDIDITLANGDVHTIIPQSKLTLEADV